MAKNGRIRILIVESDPFLATTLASSIRRVLYPEADVHVSATLKEATERVDNEVFHAVLIEHEMPDGFGKGLIRYLARTGARPKGLFFMSAEDPDALQIASLLREHPEIRYIEKPLHYSEVARQVRDTVLPNRRTDQTFYGLRLFDLIQAFNLARASVILRVLLPDGKLGSVAIRRGDLVHAAMEGAEGMDALVRMARDGRGEVRVDTGCTTAKHTIEIPTQQVLIEVFRLLDEQRADDDPSPEPTRVFETDIDDLLERAFDAEAPHLPEIAEP